VALSDRAQLKAVMVGALGALRTVANALLAVQQDAQRFDGVVIGAATTAGTTYTLPLCRLDRAMVIKDFRVLPGGAVALNASNYITAALVWNNDAGGGNTTIASASTVATSWALGTSVSLTTTTALTGTTIAAGTQIFVTITPTGTGVSIPAQTVFQAMWEEGVT
jgi:hypothetical protein